MENNVSIQFCDGENLYMQIYNWFVNRIMRGDYTKENNKLPSVRKLSKELNVNTVTVVNAYKLLEQKGFVISKTGSGTYVTEKFTYIQKTDLVQNDNDTDYKNLYADNLNFASAIPTPALVSMKDMKEAIDEIFERDREYAFGYDETSGFLPLRQSISNLLKENYNINVFYEFIQIISGAQQGIDIISKALLEHDDTVFVENPTYTGAIAVFKSRGANIVGIPMSVEGINISGLKEKLKVYTPKIIYTMPNYHNPTTICYSQKVKEQLLDLAVKHNFYIIEDDTLSDLDFNEKRKISTLKSMDSENRVIYIKSFSKILMPGLRIGFTVSPPEVFENITHAKYITDLYSSGLIQRAFDLYIRSGKWKKHISYIKEIYKAKYRTMSNELLRLKDLGVEYETPSGGMYFWLKLPQSFSSNELVKMCRQKGVNILSGNVFYLKNKEENDHYIRLCYCDVTNKEIEKGIQIMYNCIMKLKEGKIVNEKIYNSFF